MKKLTILLVTLAALASCNQPASYNGPARGADLGWLSEMEHDSMLFYNAEGEQQDCIELLQSMGCNAIRLRVWVNHTTGWCNLPDVLQMAKRVHELGLELMIDFHYSDYWADPSTQTIPAAWTDFTEDEMAQAIAEHTTEVLQALKQEGITPRWVQIGNETTNGMLWPMAALDKEEILRESSIPTELLPDTCLSNWQTYAHLNNAGYDAAKAVFPEVICIVHVDNAFIPRTNWFKRLEQAGGKWDMVGLSHYPFTQNSIDYIRMNELCEEDVRQLHEYYGCEVMITEIGTASWDEEKSIHCINDFRQRLDMMPGYAGAFYWEPEVYNEWKPAEYEALGWGAYHMGCFTPEGQPMEALYLLMKPSENPQ